eukprot:7108410-Prorocentrum_lima.AAC.1
MTSSLVGSEMCIRDSIRGDWARCTRAAVSGRQGSGRGGRTGAARRCRDSGSPREWPHQWYC